MSGGKKQPRANEKNLVAKTSSKTQKNKRSNSRASGTKEQVESLSQGRPFLIVGIGASAGGLDAIRELLQALPPDTGMAFVVVQHLDPSHESLAPDILSRITQMQVQEVKDGIRVEPNHVYLIPPNMEIALFHGHLNLLPPRPRDRGRHHVIDSFFQSLALDQKRKAIGIILSGVASDGTQGIRSIKAEGGLAISQDPKSAKYVGMPESAIASGYVDLILPPKGIAEELVRFSKHPYLRSARFDDATKIAFGPHDNIKTTGGIEPGPNDAFQKILVALRTSTQVDFSGYKQSTILRRIQRRMMVRKSESIDAYAKYLLDNPSEVKALYTDILIHVTEFFRDPGSFKMLQSQLFPQLLKNKKTDAPIRVWVPGCSTGEEAYSLAIILLELLSQKGARPPIQIFATDISEEEIQSARKGFYLTSIESVVSKDRLKAFFDKVEGGYKIKKFVRDLCLFSRHDVTRDPPFSKLDLVSCRNVLIYLGAALQRRVLPMFHYALRPDGILFLGKSEGLGGLTKLFTPVDKTHKIFLKVNIPSPLILRGPRTYGPSVQVAALERPIQQGNIRSSFQKDAERVSLSRYVPPSVIVDEGLEILHFHGQTAPCLEPGTGLPSNNLLKRARQELIQPLRTTIQAAKKNNKASRFEGLSFEVEGRRRQFNVEVIPVNPSSSPEQRNYVVFFEEVSSSEVPKTVRKDVLRGKKDKGDSLEEKYIQRITQLEADLLASSQSQRALAEEFETFHEDLTSANEELQSANEELQSTNEELETSTEELQSTNEELTTVNDELQIRNADLASLSSDLVNVLSNVEIPVVIIGSDRRIRRFTSQAEKVFNLIASDVGRPLSDLNPTFKSDLEAMVSATLKTLSPQDSEVLLENGQWMRIQVRPYRTVEDRIDGVVITLVDITALKMHLRETESALKYATSVADTLALPLVVLDQDLQILSANRGFFGLFGLRAQGGVGSNLMDFFKEPGANDAPLRQQLSKVLDEDRKLTNLEVEYEFSESDRRVLLLNAQKIKWHDSMPRALLLSIDDITDRKIMERSLEHSRASADRARADAEAANAAKDIFLATLSHELRTPLSAILSWAQLIQRNNFAPEKLKHGVQIIEQSARTQSQLIEDLLDTSRIQSGKLSINFDEIDLREPLRLAVEAVRPFADKKDISFEVEMKMSSETVLGDRDRIQQIVWNLLTNAIKFSPAGGVVRILVEAIEKDGARFVSIKVIDQGKGIRSDFLPKLFKRFSQADSSSIRVHGGLGIGLGLVRDLTQLHGGTVFAESEGLGKGSTFTVLLPVTSEAGNEEIVHAADKSEDERPNLSGLHVMIVEDDPVTMETLIETLTSFGAKTVGFGTVAKALAAFEKEKPDVLVSDIAMPLEDGYSLIRKVRELGSSRNGDVPALALTAYASKEDVERAMSAGFNFHMAKPFDTFRLGHVLGKLVKSRIKT